MEINQSIVIKSSKEKVFTALVTPGQIKKWWQANQAIVVARQQGLFAVAWGNEDNPDFVSAATIEIFDPPLKLKLSNFIYFAKGQPDNGINDLPATFHIKELSENGVELSLVQTGFPQEKPEFREECSKGWQEVLTGIKNLLENQ